MTFWDTNTATMWDVTYDEFDRPSFGAPQAIDATWVDAQSIEIDDDGKEFVSSQRFFSLVQMPKGHYILKGDHTSEPNPLSAGAREIRKSSAFDMSQFGEPDEYTAMT